MFTDNELLQENILKEGLAEVKYIYGDYKYLDNIKKAELEAKEKQLNIWSDNNIDITYTIIVTIILILIIIIFKPKKRTIKRLIKKAYQ